MKTLRFAALVAVGITLIISSAKAMPTSKLYITTVNATNSGGTWQVYVDVSHDNDGLAAFDIDILGSGGALVTSTAKLMAPRPFDPSGQVNDGLGGTMGFNNSSLFSNGTLAGGNLTEVVAGQSTIYPGTDDPTRDMGVFVGVAQRMPVPHRKTVRKGRSMVRERQQVFPIRSGLTNHWRICLEAMASAIPSPGHWSSKARIQPTVASAAPALTVRVDPGGRCPRAGHG